MNDRQSERTRWLALGTLVAGTFFGSLGWPGSAVAAPGSGMQFDRTPQKSVTDPVQLSSEWYARGAKTKRKAESAKDAQDRQKLYDRAKEELTKSVGFEATRDNLVALGQVYLALGDAASASNNCMRAASLKPGDEEAKSCAEKAQQKLQDTAAPPVGAAPAAASGPGTAIPGGNPPPGGPGEGKPPTPPAPAPAPPPQRAPAA